jgi:hypothetical protein
MDLAAAGEAKRRRDGRDPAPAPRGGSVVALAVFLVVVGLIVAQAMRVGLL